MHAKSPVPDAHRQANRIDCLSIVADKAGATVAFLNMVRNVLLHLQSYQHSVYALHIGGEKSGHTPLHVLNASNALSPSLPPSTISSPLLRTTLVDFEALTVGECSSWHCLVLLDHNKHRPLRWRPLLRLFAIDALNAVTQ